MSADKRDLQREFIFRLLQPYRELVLRGAQNDLRHPHVNDIISGACELAVSAAHFVEALRLPADTGELEALRQRLRDAGDTAKHGPLKDPARTASFSSAAAYEFNDLSQFRFLRIEVIAANRRFGAFDLVGTIGEYLRQLNARFDLGFITEPNVSLPPFGPEAEVRITENTFSVGTVNIKTYKRDAVGELVLADAPSTLFVIR